MNSNEGFDHRLVQNIDSGSYTSFDVNGNPIRAPLQQVNDNFVPQGNRFHEQPHQPQPQQPVLSVTQDYNSGYYADTEYPAQPLHHDQGYEQDPNFGPTGYPHSEYMPHGRPDENRGQYDSGYNSTDEEYVGERGVAELKEKIGNYYMKDNNGIRERDNMKMGLTVVGAIGMAAAIGYGVKKYHDKKVGHDEAYKDIGGSRQNDPYGECPSCPPNNPGAHSNNYEYCPDNSGTYGQYGSS
ncbi:hypothetical protein GGI20_002845 [Coemansia sp. BCRC 34301]|nr:hypothetical protein GGI20_002845 [Coemansia sp. BCRC 34301]